MKSKRNFNETMLSEKLRKENPTEACGASLIKTMNSLYKRCLMILAFVLGNLLFISTGYAAFTFSTATNYSIPANKALNGTDNAFTTLTSSIVITEGNSSDFSNGTYNLVLTVPTEWNFNQSGVNAVASGTGSRNITIGQISYTSTTITIPITSSGTNRPDILTITGIQVKAVDGANVPGTGNIITSLTGTGTLPTGLTGQVLATLTQTVGTLSKIVVTLPGETFTDGTDLASSGNKNTASPQTAGTAFNVKLTATDQFFNKRTDNVNITISSTGNLTSGTSATLTDGVLVAHSVNFSTGGTFTLTANNGSISTPSNSITVNNPIPTISTISPTAVCVGDFTLTVNGTNFNSSSVIKLNSTSLTPTLNSSAELTATISAAEIASAGNYSITVYNPEPGGGISTSAYLIVTNSWLGTTSDWNTSANWCSGSVPDATTDVVIPAGVTQPVITSSALCNNITINSGATLTLNETNTLTVKGNWTNNGTFTANNTSTVVFDGSAQTISNGTFNNLTISGSDTKTLSSVTVNGILSMEGTATVSAAPSYGSTATLQYNTSTDKTNGPEWTSDFTASGGVLIKNTGKITLDKTRTYTLSKLTLDPGFLIIPAGGQLSVTGDTKITSANGLTIQSVSELSGGAGTGSFITGTTTGTGTASVIRYMSPRKWHIVSSPVSDKKISEFLGANPNIPNNTVATHTSERGMRGYDPATNQWTNFYTNTTPGDIEPGKGFLIRVKNTGAQDVTFTGTLNAGPVSATGLTAGLWNCVGNPYTSALKLNSTGTDNFLDINAANLDMNFSGIYIWEQSNAVLDDASASGSYETVSNASTLKEVQQGQAFMVKMASATTLNFTTAMQSHNTGLALKSTNNIWPTIKLTAMADSITSSTIIAFHEGMTPGLDPTYDAGLLKGGASVEVYTRLIEDNGIPFDIQALPADYQSTVVPVGIDCTRGRQVCFSAELMHLPAACKVLLEDRLTATFTDLAVGSYTADLMGSTVSQDRFFLHTSYSTTGMDSRERIQNLLAWAESPREMKISGPVSSEAIATLYDLQGRAVVVCSLREGNFNSVPLKGLKQGVYLLRVQDASRSQVLKVSVGK